MKTIKFFVAALALAMSVSASAQFANTSSRSNGGNNGSGFLVKDTDNYSRIYASFSSMTFNHSVSGYSDASDDAESMNKDEKALPGFKVGYLYGINLTKKAPLFLEFGANLGFNTRSNSESDSYGKYTTSTKMLAIAIPVNLTYKLTFNNGVYVAPYAGINFKINVMGKETYEYKPDSEYASYYDSDDSSLKGSIDLFNSDSKNMGKDNAYNRFQFGGQFGLNIGYKALNFNLNYALEGRIRNISNSDYSFSTNTRCFNVGIGLNF